MTSRTLQHNHSFWAARLEANIYWGQRVALAGARRARAVRIKARAMGRANQRAAIFGKELIGKGLERQAKMRAFIDKGFHALAVSPDDKGQPLAGLARGAL